MICPNCKKEFEIGVDHIIPRIKGGIDNVDNLITACGECNLGKGDYLLKLYKDSHVEAHSLVQGGILGTKSAAKFIDD